MSSSTDLEEIRLKLGQLPVDDLVAVKSLVDNEIKARTIMQAARFRPGDKVRADGMAAGIVEYTNKLTVAVKLDRSGEIVRFAPAELEEVNEAADSVG